MAGAESTNAGCCFEIIAESLVILAKNKRRFFTIFALLELPLSLLSFSLSLFVFPIKYHIAHLESLAVIASTTFESRHVLKESRENMLHVFYLKALHFIPSYILSILAAITAVTYTNSAHHDNLVTGVTVAEIKTKFTRLVATSICTWAILMAEAVVGNMIAISWGWSLVFLVAMVYMMGVTAMGMAVSIAEESCGWDAVRRGWVLMGENRACGCILFGVMATVVSGMGWALRQLVASCQDEQWRLKKRMVAMAVGWIAMHGLVVLWGFVVSAVFCCVCGEANAKRIREAEEKTSENF